MILTIDEVADILCYGLDIGGEVAIFVVSWYEFTDIGVEGFEGIAGTERAVEFDALGGGEEFDGNNGFNVLGN